MISVIIPTLNAEKYIKTLISKLREQTIDCEVIVIDSDSNDKTVEIAYELTDKVLVIDRSEFDHGGTRNRAAKEAKGDIFVFITQDALPYDEHFLENLVSPIDNGIVSASCGRQIARKGASLIEQFARNFNYPLEDKIKSKDNIPELGIKTFFFTNVCSAVRRDAFEKVGCFPEKIILNEDMILAAKLILADHKVAYCGSAGVYHSHDYSGLQQFKRNFDIGASLKMNDWVLTYAKPESEGKRYVKEQISFVCKKGEYLQLIRCFWDNFCRYTGYKLGIHYDKIPLYIRKKCSMHSFFWN